MSIKEQLDEDLRTMEEAVQIHLNEERSRIQKLSDKIRESTENFSQVSANNKALLSEIADATKELEVYKPMDIFDKLYTQGNTETIQDQDDDEFHEADAEVADSYDRSAVVAAAAANAEANPGSRNAVTDKTRADVEAAVAKATPGYQSASDDTEDYKNALGSQRAIDTRVRRANRSNRKADFNSGHKGGRKRTRRRRRHSFRRK